MQRFFITATGTDIGKTLLTAALCWQLREAGKTVTALKPVISGYNPDNSGSDTAIILRSCGLTPTPALMETISPWRFRAPLAPAMAAAAEGKSIHLEAVVNFCHEHESLNSDLLLVEGAGGVMSPLSQGHTMLDWMERLGWPVLLVGGTYLGSMSHTLTAIAALQTRGISIRALVVSASPSAPVPLAEAVGTLEKFLPAAIPVVKIPFLATEGDGWKEVPLIRWLCDER